MPSLLLLTGLVAGQKAPPGTVVVDGIGSRVEQVVAAKGLGFWGSVLVATGGEVVFARGYGFADRRRNPLGPQCLFDLGGASQQLTRLLALRLVDDGKLRLEDPVGKFCKDWPADKAAITVAHLIAHTSGLPPEAGWGDGRAGATRTALQTIAATTLVSGPGQTSRYSQLNNNLLALVGEEAAGQRFDKLLVERVLRPFGMSKAGLVGGRFEARLLTSRRSSDNETGAPASAADWNWVHRGARGVLASVLDVHELLLRVTDGKTLDAAARAQWLQPVDGGAACSVATLDRGGTQLWRIVGDAVGYRTRWIAHPQSRSWIVMCCDDATALDDLEAGLLAVLAESIAPAGATTPVASPRQTVPAPSVPNAADLARFVGEFALPAGAGTFRIERSGDGLRLVGMGLQAAERVRSGQWPTPDESRLRKAEDRGLFVLEAALADDGSIDRDGFVAADAGAGARALLRPFAGGQLLLVGTRVERGKATSWFAVRSPDGEHLLRATWADAERLQGLELATEHPFVVPLQVVRADCAAAQTEGQVLLSVSVEGVGPRRVLVFEDASAGSEGLLDCVEVTKPPR